MRRILRAVSKRQSGDSRIFEPSEPIQARGPDVYGRDRGEHRQAHDWILQREGIAQSSK